MDLRTGADRSQLPVLPHLSTPSLAPWRPLPRAQHPWGSPAAPGTLLNPEPHVVTSLPSPAWGWSSSRSGRERKGGGAVDTGVQMPGGHSDPRKFLSLESELPSAARGHCRQQCDHRGGLLPGQQVSGPGQCHHGEGRAIGQESWAQGVCPSALQLEGGSIAAAVLGEVGFLWKGKTVVSGKRSKVSGTRRLS